MRTLALALVVLLAGCATARPTAAPSPRYLQTPLEEVGARPAIPISAASAELLARGEGGGARLVAEGPVVVGPRGRALNVASSLHRVFQALGIPSEVTCEQIATGDRRQIQIRFPSDLSESQREDVRLLLGLIRLQPVVASL